MQEQDIKPRKSELIQNSEQEYRRRSKVEEERSYETTGK